MTVGNNSRYFNYLAVMVHEIEAGGWRTDRKWRIIYRVPVSPFEYNALTIGRKINQIVYRREFIFTS